MPKLFMTINLLTKTRFAGTTTSGYPAKNREDPLALRPILSNGLPLLQHAANFATWKLFVTDLL